MGILDYYDNDEDIQINKELSFKDNLDLNPNASYFSIYEEYFNSTKSVPFRDIWTSSGIILDIKEAPKILAEMYKELGNKHMYRKLMKEYNKQ